MTWSEGRKPGVLSQLETPTCFVGVLTMSAPRSTSRSSKDRESVSGSARSTNTMRQRFVVCDLVNRCVKFLGYEVDD